MFGPFACLTVGLGVLLFLLLVLRFHPFLALILAALSGAFFSDRIPASEAVGVVAGGFAGLMGKIGILLVLASIVGKCLVDSGSADRIIRSFTRLFGAGKESYSFLASGFVLSMPVFFDVVFYLLAPLVRAAYARRKRDYALMVCAAAAGAAVTHALVPPTPGPIVVSETLGVDIGITVIMGIVLSIVPAIVGGVFYAKFINRRLVIDPLPVYGVENSTMEEMVRRSDAELPSLGVAVAPILIPVALVSASTFLDLADGGSASGWGWLAIVCDKNVAFLFGALMAIGVVARRNRLSLREVNQSLEPAVAAGTGVAFVTCAGGAFGDVLTQSGIGDVIAAAARDWGLSLLTLAFIAAALIRVAQGSATVAMITTAGIIAPAMAVSKPEFHPVYLVAVIGFGATICSWMNDSGFWIVGKMAGMTESETLKTWTVLLTVIAFAGFLWTWLLSAVFPLV